MFGDLLILVLSSFISIKPVLDFLSASTITSKSFERRLNLLNKQREIIANTQAKLEPDVRKTMGIVNAHQEHLAPNRDRQLKVTLLSTLVVLCFTC